MTWGPHDDRSMWQRGRSFDPDYARLYYLDGTRLIVERTNDGWIWTEMDSDLRVTLNSSVKNLTFLEAVKHYEKYAR